MTLSNLKKQVENLVIINYGVAKEDFVIDDILEVNRTNKIFFFIVPRNFELLESSGLNYVIVPGPVMYDISNDILETVDPKSFLMEYGTEYLVSKKRIISDIYEYEKIVKYLDKRGYLILEDFMRLFDGLNVSNENIIFSYENIREMKEIQLMNINEEQISILDNFFRDIKTSYSIKDNMLFVKTELSNSTSFYDKKLNKIFLR